MNDDDIAIYIFIPTILFIAFILSWVYLIIRKKQKKRHLFAIFFNIFSMLVSNIFFFYFDHSAYSHDFFSWFTSDILILSITFVLFTYKIEEAVETYIRGKLAKSEAYHRSDAMELFINNEVLRYMNYLKKDRKSLGRYFKAWLFFSFSIRIVGVIGRVLIS